MSRILLASLILISTVVLGQDLLSQLQQSDSKEKEFVFQTFKGSRVVNGHSVETRAKGELEFIISHRFGRINSGAYNFFGWDAAYIRFGLEYGLTSKLGVGLGRSSFNKIYDGYLKYMALRQSSGGGSPVTITALGSMALQTDVSKLYPNQVIDRKDVPLTNKLSYVTQLLIARKFSPIFSMQLTPSYMFANRIVPGQENNSQLAVGVSGRMKLNGSISLNGEYFYRANSPAASTYHDMVALALDIETGGHVFQLIFSNTQSMIDRTFAWQTKGNFFKGDIHFGFNITRSFQLKKTKPKA